LDTRRPNLPSWAFLAVFLTPLLLDPAGIRHPFLRTSNEEIGEKKAWVDGSTGRNADYRVHLGLRSQAILTISLKRGLYSPATNDQVYTSFRISASSACCSADCRR
jgi:hypothetical protein